MNALEIAMLPFSTPQSRGRVKRSHSAAAAGEGLGYNHVALYTMAEFRDYNPDIDVQYVKNMETCLSRIL